MYFTFAHFAHSCTFLHILAHFCTFLHISAHFCTFSAHSCTFSAHSCTFCTFLHIFAHSCTFLHILAHFCTFLHIFCTFLHISAHSCTFLHIPAHFCSLSFRLPHVLLILKCKNVQECAEMGRPNNLSSHQKTPLSLLSVQLITRKTSQPSNLSVVYDENMINTSHVGYNLLFKTWNLSKLF